MKTLTSRQKSGKHLYKNKYIIVFYDKTDEHLLHIFDNVHEILKYQNKEVTPQNVRLLNVELYRALLSKTHFMRIIDDTTMCVHIVEYDEDIKEDKKYVKNNYDR